MLNIPAYSLQTQSTWDVGARGGGGGSEAGIKILNCRKLICISNLNYSKVWWFEHCLILGILISLLDFVASRYLRPRKNYSSLFAFYLFPISFSYKEFFQPFCFLSLSNIFFLLGVVVFQPFCFQLFRQGVIQPVCFLSLPNIFFLQRIIRACLFSISSQYIFPPKNFSSLFAVYLFPLSFSPPRIISAFCFLSLPNIFSYKELFQLFFSSISSQYLFPPQDYSSLLSLYLFPISFPPRIIPAFLLSFSSQYLFLPKNYSILFASIFSQYLFPPNDYSSLFAFYLFPISFPLKDCSSLIAFFLFPTSLSS